MKLEGNGTEVEYDGETLRARGKGRMNHFALAGPGMKDQDVVVPKSSVQRVQFDAAGTIKPGTLTVHTATQKYQFIFNGEVSDGFEDLYRELGGQLSQQPEALRERKKLKGEYEGIKFSGEMLSYKGKQWPLSECSANVDSGANIAARMTATRVISGAVLLGPIGAVLGGLAKKNRAKVYLAVEVPDDLVLIELKAKHEGKARQFAAEINRAAAYYRKAEAPSASAAPTPTPPAPTPPPPTVPAGWYPDGQVQRYWDGSQWTDQTAPLPPQ